MTSWPDGRWPTVTTSTATATATQAAGNESKKPQQVAGLPSSSASSCSCCLSHSIGVWSSLSLSQQLMYKTLRALISYYSLFLYAIRTSISVFVVVHKKHISATTTTLRTRTRDPRMANWPAVRLSICLSVCLSGRARSGEAATGQRLLSARKSVYF